MIREDVVSEQSKRMCAEMPWREQNKESKRDST